MCVGWVQLCAVCSGTVNIISGNQTTKDDRTPIEDFATVACVVSVVGGVGGCVSGGMCVRGRR